MDINEYIDWVIQDGGYSFDNTEHHLFKKLRKALGKDIKKIGQSLGNEAKGLGKDLGNVGKGVGKILHAVGQDLKKVGESAKYVVLVPLLPAMDVMLAAHHVSHKFGVGATATAFYNNILKGHSFVGAPSNYDNLIVSNNPDHNQVGDVATIVVNAILGYFKDLKNKQANGGKLTDLEKKVLNTGDKATQKLADNAKQLADEQTAGIIQKHLGLVIGGAITLVVLMILVIGWAAGKK